MDSIPDMDDLLDELEKSSSEIILPPTEHFPPAKSLDLNFQHNKDEPTPSVLPIESKEKSTSRINGKHKAPRLDEDSPEIFKNGDERLELRPGQSMVANDMNSMEKIDEILRQLESSDPKMQTNEVRVKGVNIDQKTDRESKITADNLERPEDSDMRACAKELPEDSIEKLVTEDEQNVSNPIKESNEPTVSVPEVQVEEVSSRKETDENENDQDELARQIAEIEDWINSNDQDTRKAEEKKDTMPNRLTKVDQQSSMIDKRNTVEEDHEENEKTEEITHEIIEHFPEEKLGEVVGERFEIPPELAKNVQNNEKQLASPELPKEPEPTSFVINEADSFASENLSQDDEISLIERAGTSEPISFDKDMEDIDEDISPTMEKGTKSSPFATNEAETFAEENLSQEIQSEVLENADVTESLPSFSVDVKIHEHDDDRELEHEVRHEFQEYMDKLVDDAFSDAMSYIYSTSTSLPTIKERPEEERVAKTLEESQSEGIPIESDQQEIHEEPKEPVPEPNEVQQGNSKDQDNTNDENIPPPETIEVIQITDADDLESPVTDVAQEIAIQEGESGPPERRSVIASMHDISVINTNVPLTESELQLGKVKPYWIPDQDCSKCMLCSARFTVLNRRHHCRSCGRVLCATCCAMRRALPYIGDPAQKQRVCEPCNRTLARIDEYEKEQALRSQNASSEASHNEEGFPPVPGPSSEIANPPVVRKKSVLKKRTTEFSESEGGAPEADGNTPTSEKPVKRSVVFRDGISPGEETENQPTTSNGTPVDPTQEPVNPIKKPSKRNNLSSRRARERRADEENLCLVMETHVYLVDGDAELHRTSFEQLAMKLSTGTCVDVAIKRNLYAKMQLCNLSSYPKPVWFVSTRGFFNIGIDELVLIYEYDNSTTSETQVEESTGPSTSSLPLEVLKFFDRVFTDSLSPSSESIDEKIGIRRCVTRMNKFYALPFGHLHGIEAAAVIFQRPYGQNFEDLPIPSTPFLVGTLIKGPEVVWAMTCPNRILYRLGLNNSYYPYPLVNPRNRDPVFTNNTLMTVLKVFNDFKNWSYRVSCIPRSIVSLGDKKTEVVIPSWMKEEVKTIVESNRSMICWVLDFNDQADSHFVCEQKENGGFVTHIFTSGGKIRQATGASFLILDGALKHATEKFIVTVIEDGIVVRMQSETMEEAVRCLLAGQNFRLESTNMVVNIVWQEEFYPVHNVGALISPIDGTDLSGKYQYGLVLSRQFRSMNVIPTANEWALRLSAVINIEEGKFPSVLQPKYFDICEQIAAQIATTISPFIAVLIANNHRYVAIRIRIDSENVNYSTDNWPGLEDEHYVWTVTLDDQVSYT